MRRIPCFAAGAASILLAAMPAAAQRPGPAAAAAARPSFHNPISLVRRGAGLGRGPCLRPNRRCVARRLGFGPGLLAYAFGGLVDDPETLRDQGFFAETGDAWAGNGHAIYDYDRGYPYDWYRDSAPEAAEAAGPPPGPPSAPTIRCEINWVAAARGERAPVRVCRGRR